MTITKQRLEEIISRIEMYGHGAGYTAGIRINGGE